MSAPYSINVCFSTTDRCFSRFLRWFTKSRVSHALVTFRDETLDKVLVMEATGKGFHLKPWASWKQHNTLVSRFELNLAPEVILQAIQKLTEELGAEYDLIGLFGFLLRRWRKRYKNPLDDTGKMFCSEAVAKFLRYCGLINDDPASYTPSDLFVLLANANGVALKVE